MPETARVCAGRHRGIAAVLVLAAALGACHDVSAPGSVSVPLAIATLSAPDTVDLGAVIPIDATVEFGGCTTFSGLSVGTAPGQIILAAWGQEPSAPTVCPQFAALARVHVDMQAPESGEVVTIRASEPAGTAEITRDVHLRQVIRAVGTRDASGP